MPISHQEEENWIRRSWSNYLRTVKFKNWIKKYQIKWLTQNHIETFEKYNSKIKKINIRPDGFNFDKYIDSSSKEWMLNGLTPNNNNKTTDEVFLPAAIKEFDFWGNKYPRKGKVLKVLLT